MNPLKEQLLNSFNDIMSHLNDGSCICCGRYRNHLRPKISQALDQAFNAGLDAALEGIGKLKIDIPTRKIHLKEIGISKHNRQRRRKEAERFNEALEKSRQAIKERRVK